MANVRKKISELTALVTASLDTTIVGVDGGTTYKIELDTLADAVASRVNILDRDRLTSLESVTSSFESKGRNIVSGSSQLISSFDQRYVISGSVTQTTWDNISGKPDGIVSQSTDLSLLNQFTSSQSTINTAFTNGISGRLTTSSFNSFTASQSTASLVNILSELEFSASRVTSSISELYENGFIWTQKFDSIESVSGSWITENETGSFLRNLNGAISSSSQLTSSYDTRYVISGSVGATPLGTISGSAQITAFGFISSSHTDITSLNSFTSSQSTLNTAFNNGISARLQTSSFNDYTASVNGRITTLESSIITGSVNYVQKLGSRVTGITSTGVTIISETITTTGNPVQIMVTGDANPIGGTAWSRLQIFRDGNGIGGVVQVENTSNLNVPYCLNVIDTPSAGTYTYSMRTVSGHSGTFDFGEHTGPVLTAVELKTNTNLPSTNNTFTGNNTFNGITRFETVGGDEGGEIQFGVPQTNTTLQNRVTTDVWQNRLRIFEGSNDAKGVYIDLSKAPAGNGGEITWKTSGFVNAGTFLTLDNLKVSVTTSGYRGLSVGSVSTNFTANIAGWYGFSGGGGGAAAINVVYTTTAASSAFGWGFNTEGDGSNYIITDKTNNRVYRVTLMIGFTFNNNFISIERLH